jgi:LuxR family maltose regulon positive regulatory protein
MMNTESFEPQEWLAETKFRPPLLRQDVIPRRRLLEDLRTRLGSYPLTLLSAPAGYGKTTVLAALPPTYPELSTAWLSLDEEDNDPVRFLTALITALQRLDPDCGTISESLLASPIHQSAGVLRVISVLINDILETFSNPFTLILDDLHRITEPSIFVALDYLLEHRPPALRLVVATRVDPPLALARLRARGELSELRLTELRFTEEETGLFLNDHLNLGLSPGDLALLHARTEGWPVGLRLLASSLDRATSAEGRRQFIHHLAKTDRNVFDFLTEEVFSRQEEATRAFLLETAILPELTPSLCQAVTGRPDAGTVLEELYRRNLYLVQISPSQRTLSSDPQALRFDRPRLDIGDPEPERRYRYHDLFAQVLRHKLVEKWPERVGDLHLRAARAESEPVRAVGHYLAARSWPEAADLIEQIGAEMFARGYLDSLIRWIGRLPARLRESRPRLLHYLSHCALWKGSFSDVQSLLERALRGFKAAGNEAAQGEVLADLAAVAAAQGDLERSGALFGHALAKPVPPQTRVQSLLGHALARGTVGDWAQAERDFNAAMALVEQSGELDPLHVVTLPFFHPDFAVVPGGLEHLERICEQARAQVGAEVSPSRLMVEELTTLLHLYRGQLPEAIRSGEIALDLRERLGGHPFLSLNAALFLLIAYAARGHYAAAEPLFDVVFEGIDQMSQPPPDLPLYLYYAGRVRWLQGRLREARDIYDQMRAAITNLHQDFPEARICRAWMWSLLEMARGHYEQAERTLRQPEVLEQRDRASRIHGNTRLMLARLYWEQGRQGEALAQLAPVLAYYERLGIPFAILLEGQSVVALLRLAVEQGIHENYAGHLLNLLGADDEPRPIRVPDTGETLTPREVEVLGLIARGLSNATIGEKLFIAESTVKTHNYHIFAKLDVSTRTEAAARARELSIL